MTPMAAQPGAPTSYGTGVLRSDPGSAYLVAVAVCRASDTAPRTLRHFVQHTARQRGITPDLVADLALICTELATNAVLHSGSHDVTVSLRLSIDHLVLGVDDHGRWKMPGQRINPLQALGGRGLDLVRTLAATSIHHTPDGTRVRCRLPLTAPDTTKPHDPS